jgi:hypothetical protein
MISLIFWRPFIALIQSTGLRARSIEVPEAACVGRILAFLSVFLIERRSSHERVDELGRLWRFFDRSPSTDCSNRFGEKRNLLRKNAQPVAQLVSAAARTSKRFVDGGSLGN